MKSNKCFSRHGQAKKLDHEWIIHNMCINGNIRRRRLRRRKRALVKCCGANAITMYHKKAESKRATAEKKSLMNSNSRWLSRLICLCQVRHRHTCQSYWSNLHRIWAHRAHMNFYSRINDFDLSAAEAICAYRFRYERVPIGLILALALAVQMVHCNAWREFCFCEVLVVALF